MKKYKYLEPKAKKVINSAKKSKAIVLMMIDGFQTDVEALYLRDMLWYARDCGVVVEIIPKI